MKYRAIVRYGSMSHVGNFRVDYSGLRMHDWCIIRTDRGVEHGRILSPVEPFDGDDTAAAIIGEIVRKMNADDQKKLRQINDVEQTREFDYCKKKIQERALPMKLVSVEHLLGGSKIIFYFLAEGRVDFRELVKDLAQEYHTRIEMRQIGVRDEARLLADYEHCGRELCCKTFIKNLEPVTMKMAKNQKATLDPTKISGRCGRLMCCLRYEDRTYEDLRVGLPEVGSRVAVKRGEGDVVNVDPLSQTVTVEFPEKERENFKVADIKVIAGPPKKDKGADQPARKPEPPREPAAPAPEEAPKEPPPNE
jgi:cell fate regulator YaaT (PSP1 superfamily)